MTGPAAPGPGRRTTVERVREVFSSGGFRRLFATRVVSQLGDGIFQLAAADVLLFQEPSTNPALTLTVISVVTLMPFSAIGPFSGVFIDRWERRKILSRTPLVRACFAALTPLVVNGNRPLFYLVVLTVLSANRFFLATMSTVLPQLVPRDDLLVANSVATTGGSIANVTGLGLGALLSGAFGGDRAALIAAAGFAVAAALARTVPAHRGFEPAGAPFGEAVREVLRELVEGVRRVRESRRATYALSAIAAVQTLVGAMSASVTVFFISILGLKVRAASSLLGVLAVGIGLGVVLVPFLARRVQRDALIPLSFLISGLAVLATGAHLTRFRVVAGSVFVGISYALAKIPVDTIVQEELPDAFRGRAFAAYDLLFNMARVLGTALAALAVAAHARLGTVVLAIGGSYLVASAFFRAWSRRLLPVGRTRKTQPAPAVLLPVGELVTVRAYAGSRADEEPRAVVVGGRDVPIDEIEWRAVEERGGERRRVFVVRIRGMRVRLAYVESTSLWEVERALGPGGAP
jgi:MFS family permease